MNQKAPRSAPSFDPANHGTRECEWAAALSETPSLILPEADIVVVSPHPDDETLGAGGLIHVAAHLALEVSVLSVTDGESAYPDWKDLRKVRRRELARALIALSSYPVGLTRLGIPDGGVSRRRSLIFDALDRMVSSTTLIVAPYELDGHPDHQATGEACVDFAHRRGLILWRYPIWMWHHGNPNHLSAQRLGRFWFHEVTRRAKSLAIDCFASQLRPTSREPIVPSHVLPYFARPYEAFFL